MPLFAIAALALVIVLTVHVFHTGRPKLWLLLIWAMPVVGSLIYVLAEMLPQLLKGEGVISLDSARNARQRDVTRRRDPDARQGSDLQWSRRGGGGAAPPPKARESAARESAASRQDERLFKTPKDPLREGMIHEKLRRAEECLAAHRFDEAIDLFAAARQGFFADSPDIVFGLARAHFGRGDLAAASGLLDELATGRPAWQPHAVAILKARVLAQQGDTAAATALLDAILTQTDNLEGRRLEAQYRRAEILWQSGAIEPAMADLAEITRHEKLFRVGEDERRWIRLATQALQAIS